MPPVPQVAQRISQEGDQQQNGPNLPSLHNSFPFHSRNPAFPQQMRAAGWDKKHVVVDPAPVPSPQQILMDGRIYYSNLGRKEQIISVIYADDFAKPDNLLQIAMENEILQRITALRKEGLWSLKRLPKLHEAPRHKSHHDYLLEEMQWMATDFVQERRWKIVTARRLILSVAHHHEDMVLHKEMWKKREEKQLRAVAAFTAREIEHFWSTIKQVVDLKLQVELEERRKKALNLQNVSRKEKRDSSNKNESLQKEVVLPDPLTSTVEKSMADLAGVAAAAGALLPQGSAQTTTAVKWDTPSLLRGILRDYQKTGLEWLAKLYKMNLNGILADEAGLGKTVQVVAFFAHLACNEGNWGPILVVSQNFNVLKWEVELKRWCPALKILLYLGNPGELFKTGQEWLDPSNFNVCIASCQQFLKDYEAFMKVQWRYLVLDERQDGNDLTEKHWDAIFHLQSHHRLLLMNKSLPTSLKDLWAIACFLIPEVSQSYSVDSVKAASVEENKEHYQRVAVRLQRVVQSFVLQRSKIHVEKQLPRKYEHVLTCALSNRQKAMYKDILSQPRAQECLQSGHFASVLQVLTQLLRVCDHPDLLSPHCPRSPCVLDRLQITTASPVLDAVGWDLWKHADRSLFDVIGMENQITCYEAQVLPKLKVTRKLIEEIYCSPSAPRPEPVKLKPNRLFTPVQYGQKPDGRTKDFSRSQLQQTVDTATVMAEHHEKIQRRQPLALFSNNQHRKASKSLRMASTAGAQERIAETEKPVTLQFRGKMFTVSYSQFCQLIDRQSLRHQVDDLSTKSKSASTLSCPTQGILEEKRQLKEHLDKIHSWNERRCSRTPLYGRDLLETCSWIGERKTSQHCSARVNKWRWAGFANCLPCPSTPEVLKDPLQDLILTVKQQQIALKDVITRYICVLPAVAVAPPCLYVTHPPYTYTHGMKLLKFNLKEQLLPYSHSVQQMARPHFVHFPDPRLVQWYSGKMEALAVLLQQLKARGERVLIWTQMIPMLDILELFLSLHLLTYVRVGESGAHSWHYLESIKNFNQDKRIFCALLSSHTPSTGVSHVDVNAVVFYGTGLDLQGDAKAEEWCAKIARGRDIHIYRLISGNSVEERLLKKGIKHLIQELAAQGDNCSTDFLTQVFCSKCGKEDSRKFTEETQSELRNDTDSELYDSRNTMVSSQLEEQLANLVDQLKPIEKYAFNFLELCHTLDNQKSQTANKELKIPNIKWEHQHAKELEKAEQKFQEEGREELLTYTRQDAYNTEFVSEGPDGEIEIMPLWTPPVVPENHADVYTDSVLCLMYSSTPIPESELPPVFVRKAGKRQRSELSSSGERKKRCHRRLVVPPPSLFDQVAPRIMKTRQKSQAQKALPGVPQKTYFGRPLSALTSSAADTGQDGPAWLIAEDVALLKAMKQSRTAPLNLAVVSPAQTANWDFVSDVVNSSSYVYRSPKQCQSRYTRAFAGPEGKNPGGSPLRVRQAYAKDRESERTQIYMNHFELVAMTSRKRSSSKRFLAENYEKLLPLSGVVSTCAEPLTVQEKALSEEHIAPQMQEQQPGQQQEEEQTVEQIQTQH